MPAGEIRRPLLRKLLVKLVHAQPRVCQPDAPEVAPPEVLIAAVPVQVAPQLRRQIDLRRPDRLLDLPQRFRLRVVLVQVMLHQLRCQLVHLFQHLAALLLAAQPPDFLQVHCNVLLPQRAAVFFAQLLCRPPQGRRVRRPGGVTFICSRSLRLTLSSALLRFKASSSSRARSRDFASSSAE